MGGIDRHPGFDRLGVLEVIALGELHGRESVTLAADPLALRDVPKDEKEPVVEPGDRQVHDEAIAWLEAMGSGETESIRRMGQTGLYHPDAGRRDLAVATFARLSIVGTGRRASHRIVSVEETEEAERRGLVLALPASIEVTMVGDTGFEPVTSRM